MSQPFPMTCAAGQRNVISIYLKQCNLKNCGVHALRHTFATNCVRAGVDLRTLSELLGHTKVSFTMQLYVHSDLETKRAAMRKLEGLY